MKTTRSRFPVLAAALALGLLAAAPSPARVRPTSTIADLGEDYEGWAVSTDSNDIITPLILSVEDVEGDDFAATLFALELAGVGATGPGLPIPVTGSVSSKGKFKMAGFIVKGLKFNAKGTLSDTGFLINCNYTAKNGKKTVEKGILSLTAADL